MQDPLASLRGQARRVIERAIATGRTVATVESCTGGLIASLLTDTPGASAVYRGGWVPYSDTLKTATLGIDPASIARHGAVSGPIAMALAAAARERADADLAVATTGILGPTGGTPAKPVGLVWIGLADARGVRATPHQGDGDRLANKRAFAQAAFAALLAALDGLQDSA